jgi:hypothetical protein
VGEDKPEGLVVRGQEGLVLLRHRVDPGTEHCGQAYACTYIFTNICKANLAYFTSILKKLAQNN